MPSFDGNESNNKFIRFDVDSNSGSKVANKLKKSKSPKLFKS